MSIYNKVYNLENIDDYYLLESDIFEIVFDNVLNRFNNFVFDQVFDHLFTNVRNETIEAIFENLPEETSNFVFHQFFNYVEETIEDYMSDFYSRYGDKPFYFDSLLFILFDIINEIEKYKSRSIDVLEEVVDHVHESVSRYVSHHFNEIVNV